MRNRCYARSCLALLGLTGLLVLPPGVSAQTDPWYILSLSSEVGLESESATVTSSLRLVLPGAIGPVYSWSYGICHDEVLLNPLSAELGADSILIDGGTPPDFLQINVIRNGDENPGSTPGVNIGLVISFLGMNPLTPGNDYEILEVEYELGDAGLAQVSYCETTDGAVSPVSVQLHTGSVGPTIPTTTDGEVLVLEAPALYTLRVTDAIGGIGSEQAVNVLLDIDPSALRVAGWSFGVCHDDSRVDVVSAAAGETTLALNGGAGPDFEQINVVMNGDEPFGTDPGVSISLLISFLGMNPLPAGTDYDILDIVYLLEGPAGTAAIATCNDVQGSSGTVDSVVTGEGGTLQTPFRVGGSITMFEVVITFERGDCSADGTVDIADVVQLADYLFTSGASPTCLDACDADDDGILDIVDPIYLVNALTALGAPVPAPSGGCGDDPTDDGLECVEFGACP